MNTVKSSPSLVLSIFITVLLTMLPSCKDDVPTKRPVVSDKEFMIEENSPNATEVGTISVESAEKGAIIEYAITSGNTGNVFAIDKTLGIITVVTTELLNYERSSSYSLAVKVSDIKNDLYTVITVTIAVTNAVEIPTNGLVAHYTLNGNANDISGNNNNGTIIGAISAADRLGQANQSYNFDSSDDYIEVNNPSFISNTQGTFVAWVKFSNLDHIQYVASAGDLQSIDSYISFIRLDEVTKTLGIYQREASMANWIEGTTVIQANKYYFVVMMSDGLGWSMYINGVKESLKIKSGINSGKWIGNLVSIDNFVIGSSRIKPPFTIPYMAGNIDEVLMYNRALKEAEIELIYNDTKPL